MNPSEIEGLKKDLLLAEAEVVLELRDAVHSQGDLIRGALTIIPHDRARDGKGIALAVELREVWASTDDDDDSGSLTTRTRGSIRQRVEFAADEGEEVSVVRRKGNSVQLYPGTKHSFRLRLPTNARLTTQNTGWQLAVRQVESLAQPDQARLPLPVAPAEEFIALLATFRALRFREDESRRRWDPSLLTTHFTLAPPKALSEVLEEVALELLQTPEGLKGKLCCDREEQTFTDYFKALVGANRVERELEFTRADLVRGGEPNVEDLRPRLREIVKDALGLD
jgi:hypothetical protein